MAVEVLKRGHLTPPKTWTQDCPKCRSLVRYGESDIEALPPDPGDQRMAKFVPCPVCGERLWHTPSSTKRGAAVARSTPMSGGWI